MRGRFVSPSLFSRSGGGRWEKRAGVMRGQAHSHPTPGTLNPAVSGNPNRRFIH